MSAVEFRKHAAEHLDWAKTAKSDRERQTFQQMAEAWLEAAVLWDMPGATKDRTGSSTERTLDTLRKPPARQRISPLIQSSAGALPAWG